MNGDSSVYLPPEATVGGRIGVPIGRQGGRRLCGFDRFR